MRRKSGNGGEWCLSTSGGTSSQWAAISMIARKIGCTPQPVCNWVRRAARDQDYVVA
jgi:transposase-like protein